MFHHYYQQQIRVCVCFIYLLFKYLNPPTVGTAHINAKERQVRRAKKRKGIDSQRMKHPTPPRAIDALIGDEEQNGKLKRTEKKAGSESPTQLTWTNQSPPTTRRDYTVGLFF